MTNFIDCHTHVQFKAFEQDMRETIQRALDAGVWLVNVGTQADTSRRAVEVAHEFKEGVYAAVGLHPVHTDRSYHDEQELGAFVSTSDSTLSNSRELENKGLQGFMSRGETFDFDYYRKLAENPLVVAIGECGLDYCRATSDMGQATWEEKKKKQRDVFVQQIELAHAVKKPLMIHCRDAYPDLLKLLYANRHKLCASAPGVIHFFAGDIETARQFLELGFSFTFGGVITFPPRKAPPAVAASFAKVDAAMKAKLAKTEHTAGDYDEAIRYIPNDRILSETDAPYVAPVPYRGKRNEPAYVIEVVKKLTEIKGITLEEMKGCIWENARRVFSI